MLRVLGATTAAPGFNEAGAAASASPAAPENEGARWHACHSASLDAGQTAAAAISCRCCCRSRWRCCCCRSRCCCGCCAGSCCCSYSCSCSRSCCCSSGSSTPCPYLPSSSHPPAAAAIGPLAAAAAAFQLALLLRQLRPLQLPPPSLRLRPSLPLLSLQLHPLQLLLLLIVPPVAAPAAAATAPLTAAAPADRPTCCCSCCRCVRAYYSCCRCCCCSSVCVCCCCQSCCASISAPHSASL